MMYQHSLPLTYFTWHTSVTRLVGGINGHQESGNFLEKEEKEEKKGGKCYRVGGGRGEEEVHSNYRNPGDPLLHQPSPPCPLHINRTQVRPLVTKQQQQPHHTLIYILTETGFYQKFTFESLLSKKNGNAFL